ncbi:hypothetical protein cyc_00823 [Cyclospora cayetanensis]|uniref:Uncharacterized protein n=1 Tax=Cyclospora cayetanensis TaxID=88456 RepID=A0A1D3CT39_9EIME|nr:hypothetical protein cyc_00823 [Cyclospora cayetanensis]
MQRICCRLSFEAAQQQQQQDGSAAAETSRAAAAGEAVDDADEFGYAALLLPEDGSLDGEAFAALPPAAADRVLKLLQEARDVLDSPAFAAAVRGVCTAAASCIVQRVVEALQNAGILPLKADTAAAGVKDPYSIPFQLARSLGCICRLADWALGVGVEGQLLQRLAASVETQELSALCYWNPQCDFARGCLFGTSYYNGPFGSLERRPPTRSKNDAGGMGVGGC